MNRVHVAVGDPKLARAIGDAIESAFRDFPAPPRYPVLRLRTFRRLEAVAAKVAGRIAVVRVTEAGLRRLPALVEEIRAKGALGVQLVWDGTSPPRSLAEPTLFRILETARATKDKPPVMLAADRFPVAALRTAIRTRQP